MKDVAAAFAWRELRGGLRGFRVFLACLALGVAAIAAVGSVERALQEGLADQGAVLLGGDAEMALISRFASAEERAWMDQQAIERSVVAEFRSLLMVGEGATAERALSQVKAVDEAYPLYGTFQLEEGGTLAEALAGQDGLPGAVLAPVLADRLGLATGDRFRIGQQSFVLMGRIAVEPDAASGGFALGPRSLVRRSDLEASGLLGPGSIFEAQYRLALPEGTDLAAMATLVENRFADVGYSWRDARDGAPEVSTFVDRLGRFLVLVGLSGLAVGGVGVATSVSAYLASKTSVIATLRTLGAPQAVIARTYLYQIAVLAALGIALGLLIGGGLPLLAAPIILARLPIPAELGLHPAPLIEAAIYGAFAAALFSLWPLGRASQIRAAALYRDALSGAQRVPPWSYLVASLVAAAGLVATAAWFSDSVQLTVWMAGGIAMALAMLALAALLLRLLARVSARIARGRTALRAALAAIAAPREQAGSVVMSLGLGLAVLAAIGQIDGTLRNSIQGGLPEVAPSFFVLDIQPDQIEAFNAVLADNPAVSDVDSAPLLRGVLTRINDRPAKEVAGDHWVVRGDRGVTYSARLPERSQLTEGAWWPEDYNGPNLISFAAEEGAEMGLSIGDKLTVNVLGRNIEGEIASFRDVDFSDAGMGFVMSFSPNALAGAPHSFLATIYAEPEAEAALLRDLATRFPNITVVGVRETIDRVAGLLGDLANATRWAALVTLATGLLVLIGAAAAGQNARAYEAALLKTLGASRQRILISFALRSALTGAAAGGVAILAGITGGWAVSTYVFQINYDVLWPSALGVVAFGAATSLAAGLVFALRPLRVRPASVLRFQE